MRKTKKYFIQFENIDTLLTNKAIEISAEQYWNELKHWDDIIEKTKDDENAGQAHKYTAKPLDRDKSILYMDSLHYGCATVYLYREECKEGYAFVPKKGHK